MNTYGVAVSIFDCGLVLDVVVGRVSILVGLRFGVVYRGVHFQGFVFFTLFGATVFGLVIFVIYGCICRFDSWCSFHLLYVSFGVVRRCWTELGSLISFAYGFLV